MATQRDQSLPVTPQASAERLLDEGALPIVEAARREGIGISAKTALRWALHGTAGVRLESVRVGGRRMTSRAALRRFIAAQQRNATPAKQSIDPASADAVLASHGLSR